MNHDGSSFLCGHAVLSSALFFSKSGDELTERDTPNSSFFLFGQPSWGKYEFDMGWAAVSMSSCKEEGQDRVVVAVSTDGDYWEALPASVVESSGKIENAKFALSNLTNIDETIYACGMGRTVLERFSEGAWKEIGPGDQAGGGEIVGFEDMDGFSSKEIYAVGWSGEIWRRQNARWKRMDSPTNVILNAVCCADDERVYAVGDDGILVVGRGNKWITIETGVMDRFQDVAFYLGALYVCTDFQILKLNNNGELMVEMDFKDLDDKPETCLHLLGCGEAIFSMGPKDLFRNTDGVWERLV